jgi:hypothetical protein
MIEQYLWIGGSAIFLILGAIHLVYTFFTDKFSSKNTQVVEQMKNSFPVLTKQTTIWKAWTGFNASHSAGAIFMGLINIYLAAGQFMLLQHSWFLLAINISFALFWLWLARRYWFFIPFAGILISNLCFSAAIIIMLVK